jgi:hypothetical protein
MISVFHRYFLIFALFGLIVMTLLIHHVVYSKLVQNFFSKIAVVDRSSHFTQYSGNSLISLDVWQISFHLYYIILGIYFGRVVFLSKFTVLVKIVFCCGLFLLCFWFVALAPPLFLLETYPFVAQFTSLLFYILIDISFLVLLTSGYNIFVEKMPTCSHTITPLFRCVSVAFYVGGVFANIISLVLSRNSFLFCLLCFQLVTFVVLLPLILFCFVDNFHFPGLFILGSVTLYNSSFIDLPFSSYFISWLWSSLSVVLLFIHAVWLIYRKPISFYRIKQFMYRSGLLFCSSGSNSPNKLLEKDNVSIETAVELSEGLPFLQSSSFSRFSPNLPESFQHSSVENFPSIFSDCEESSDDSDLISSFLLVLCSVVAYCPIVSSYEPFLSSQLALFENNLVSSFPKSFRICWACVLLLLWLIHWLLFYFSLFWRNDLLCQYQQIKHQLYQRNILKNQFLVYGISTVGEECERIRWN